MCFDLISDVHNRTHSYCAAIGHQAYITWQIRDSIRSGIKIVHKNKLHNYALK